jgi:Flp pilus assembly protein protease CpaA
MAIAIAGGVLSIGYLACFRAIRRTAAARAKSSVNPRRAATSNGWLANERVRILAGKSVPYAVAIMAGVFIHVSRELYQCLSATFCSL